MGCRQTYTIAEAVLGENSLDDACYVPAPVDKIFGTLGPHLLKFNATTGARESFIRVTGPAYGTCRICYHSPLSMLYVSIWNIPNRQWADPPSDWSVRSLYPVNPVSLAVGTPLDIRALWYSDEDWPNGPRHVFSAGGTYLYVVIGNGDINTPVEYWRVNPLNVADRATPLWGESIAGANAFNQLATSGTRIYAASAGYYEIQTHDLNLTNGSYDYCSVNAPDRYVDNPVSVAWSTVNSLVYAVCGTANLMRVDTFAGATGSYTMLAMNAASVTGMPALTAVRPVRMRYRASDAKLYIPCQGDNGVIVWDPVSETGVWKSGFAFPIDVVFTATKAFAVGHGITGLQEIT